MEVVQEVGIRRILEVTDINRSWNTRNGGQGASGKISQSPSRGGNGKIGGGGGGGGAINKALTQNVAASPSSGGGNGETDHY